MSSCIRDIFLLLKPTIKAFTISETDKNYSFFIWSTTKVEIRIDDGLSPPNLLLS
ncbi:hypothetical protein HMPREF9093_00802 [Fusobacterium sp. oral taxon 370 str. F0437]|nr:hypothetical protein HMPREF9093_00802 [Fusobacterium sp. oral taxon 370 str. F0437]